MGQRLNKRISLTQWMWQQMALLGATAADLSPLMLRLAVFA
jgi:hypothetical protein